MHEPLIAAKLAVLAIGLFISYQAYRGYQRNAAPAMKYLAIGFAFISLATAMEGLLFEVLHAHIYHASTVQTVVSAVGMLVILYSLYGDHEMPSESGEDTGRQSS